jgi:tetratricopeptide (TPR) repeat protein
VKTNQGLIFITLIMVLLANTAPAQEVDPFYLALFKKSEQDFLNGDFENAIKQLKIANFGIQPNIEIKAKVCAYLALSYYYINQKAEGQKNLNELEDLIGEKGIESLDIDERVKFDLKSILKVIQSGERINAAGLRALPQIPLDRISEGAITDREQLEREIEHNAKNINLYYELYTHHRLRNNLEQAKKAIEKLVENNPEDVFGYYMLGLILYQERKFQDASSHLRKFFQRSVNLGIRQEIQAEARAHQILSLYYNGDREDAERLIYESKEILAISRIQSLYLAANDKRVLRELLEETSR